MHTVYILHRNNVPMTMKAIESVEKAKLRPYVLDNSDEMDFASRTPLKFLSSYYSPNVFSFAAIHNDMASSDSYFWMHNDVEAPKETFDALLEAYNKRTADVGVIFANYDCISWVNGEAIQDAGWWDLTLPQYFSDVDIYRRVRLAGYKTIELGLPLTHHKSGSLQDPMQNLKSKMTYYLYEEYYKRKWGGEPLQEKYQKPFEPYIQ